MASPPSFGLGGSTNHSSRDLRLAEPNQEVDRPIASQGIEIDRRSFCALPATPNPHNGARTWGSNSNTSENGPEPPRYLNSSEDIIVPPKPFAVTVWNTNDNWNRKTNEVRDMYSNRKTSEVRDSLNADAETYVRTQSPYNSTWKDTPNLTNPVGSKANPMRMDTANNTNSVGSKVNPTRTDMPNNENSICNSTNARSVRLEVRPDELIELSNAYEQTSSYAVAPRANSANSYYSEHITPIVRWSEPPVTGSKRRRTPHNITQTPDLFTPDESVYYTARQTDRCSRECPTSTDIRERRKLEFDSTVEAHEAQQNRTKNDETNTRRSSRNSRRSSSRTRSGSNSRANLAHRSSRSSTRAKHKRRTSSSRSEERSTSRCASHMLTFKALHGLAPTYLADLCQPVASVGSRQRLRSDIRAIDTVNAFKTALKTFLFRRLV